MRFLFNDGRAAKISQVMIANVFNNLAALGISLHAARKLGPEGFGALGVVLAVTAFGSTLLDFGVSVGLVRNYNSADGAATRADLVGGVLKAKLLQVIAAAVLAYPAALLLRSFLPVVHSPLLLALGLFSAGLMSLWSGVRSLEQASRDYRKFARNVILFGALRFVAYAVTLLAGKMSLATVLCDLYVWPLLLLLAWALGIWEREALKITWGQVATQARALWSVVKYGFWVASSLIVFSLFARLPVFALGRSGSAREVGYYSAALTFIGGFGLIWDAMSTVLVPEISGLQTPESRVRFRRMIFKRVPVLFVLLLGAIAACVVLQTVFLGAAYRGSMAAFLVLGAATTVCMCISVNNNLVHAYGVPGAMTVMNLGRLIACLTIYGIWPPVRSLDAAIIYAAFLVAGDSGLFLYLHQKTRQDLSALMVRPAA